jgi:hypothetical protein
MMNKQESKVDTLSMLSEIEMIDAFTALLLAIRDFDILNEP